jgi:hypothetical protein
MAELTLSEKNQLIHLLERNNSLMNAIMNHKKTGPKSGRGQACIFEQSCHLFRT